MVCIIAEAVQKAKSANPIAVRDGLEQIRDFPGLTGNIGFSPKTHQAGGLSMALSVLEQGKPKDLGRYLPESLKK